MVYKLFTEEIRVLDTAGGVLKELLVMECLTLFSSTISRNASAVKQSLFFFFISFFFPSVDKSGNNSLATMFKSLHCLHVDSYSWLYTDDLVRLYQWFDEHCYGWPRQSHHELDYVNYDQLSFCLFTMDCWHNFVLIILLAPYIWLAQSDMIYKYGIISCWYTKINGLVPYTMGWDWYMAKTLIRTIHVGT